MQQLQIVSFDVPWPATYGGTIDVLHRIRSLHRLGIAVHLHAFRYKHSQGGQELENLCASIHYYKRPFQPWLALSALPYIIASRKHPQLLHNLAANPAPILFEGMHCMGWMGHPSLSGHSQILRMHNLEWEYYAHLATDESNPLKRIWMRNEAHKLKQVACTWAEGITIAGISAQETQRLNMEWKAKAHWIPAFHPHDTLAIPLGIGTYHLFHGNLAVAENVEAVLELANLPGAPQLPVVIAGRAPHKKVVQACHRKNWKLVANPDEKQMNQIVQGAQCHLFPIRRGDGVKLKWLQALFAGRHSVGYAALFNDPTLCALSHTCTDPSQFWNMVALLEQSPVTEQEKQLRQLALAQDWSNSSNAQKLCALFDGIGTGQ